MKLPKVAYVVKRYPRYSETFIVNEILAHEAAGLELEIIAIRPCTDTHFQDRIARVRAPVTVLPSGIPKGETLWALMHDIAALFPGVWEVIADSAQCNLTDLYQALLVSRMIYSQGITHLHAHFATDSTSVARLASLITGIPYTFTAHAKDIYHESVNPLDLRRKLRDAAAVVTVSDYNLEYLRSTFGGDAQRVRRIYNGMDLDAFTYADPSVDSLQILAVGRLVEKKGFGVLLDSCRLLLDRGVQFTCLIIGQGEEEAKLRALINGLGLVDVVTLGGPRPQAEVIQAIRQSAVMAAPCIVGDDGNRDGMPTVLLEAMALGTPCISTDVTGIPEAIEDGVHGLIVRQNDPRQLADALQEILANPSLRTELSRAARERVESQFSVQNSTACLREIFQQASSVVNKRTTGREAEAQRELVEVS